MKTFVKNFYPLITLLFLVLLWWIVAIQINIEIVMPKPSLVFKELILLFSQKEFYFSVLNSVFRVFYSFFIAFVFAFIFALISTFFVAFKNLFYPIVVMLRATPTMSIILLCLIWLTSKQSPILIAFLVMFPMLYTAFYQSFNSVDKDLAEMSKIYKVSKINTFTKLFIPQISIKMFPQIVNFLSFNVKIIIAGEALAQTNLSLGGSMQISKINLETAKVFAFTLIAILLSYILELILKLLKIIILRLYK